MSAEQKQTVPEEVLELVERFERDRHVYESAQYNETQLRREFLDPFFKALGWDVDNTQGYAPAYRDVIHEDAIKIGGYTKAPDYCFRIGGTRKFFVEAKKPAVNLKEDVSPAFQLRRYAWSNKLPLSILTDFEEFAVYDCRVKPVKTDAPSTARLIYITFDQYAERFDEIAAIFSREAVLKGSFDRYAESTKAKRGTAEVDVAFLKEIESWRDALARNLAIRNLGLSTRDLNFAVQATIDRIVFLRICEDRGIEDYGRLLGLVSGPHIYERLFKLFHEADEKYNSGLFHFRHEAGEAEAPDDLTPSLTLDDKVLAGIIKTQYYPDSPYEFSVLPADILGQVYEQFLGKVIRLTAGHRAVVEDKPEVKKAGGVYYTPTYIVEYIVKNTVGKLVEGKKPAQIAKLRILDPACGSGSFLVGAYQFLLDWHRDWYVNDGSAKHAKKGVLREAAGGDWRLTTPERKRILTSNIYGVDIDPAAVEVTKLSLLLKVLEDETQTTMFRERVLPDLGNNIKCGNSLIGTDFYEGVQMAMFHEEERARINPFDWETEFAEIMKNGGFDAVIGNPPYVRIQAMKEWAPVEVELYKQQYASASKGNYDIYVVFAERALSLLNKAGHLGFILPHKFFNARYGEPLRRLISAGRHLEEIVHFGDQQVFAGASTYTCLLFLRKRPNDAADYAMVDDLGLWQSEAAATKGAISADKVGAGEWNFVVGRSAAVFEKLGEAHRQLGSVTTGMFVGQQTSADTVYLFKEWRATACSEVLEVLSQELREWISIEAGILRRVVRSGSIGRYCASPTAWVLFPYEVKDCHARLYSPTEMEQRFPRAWEYLGRNKGVLEGREKGAFRDGAWYRFGRSQNLGMWEQPKVMVPYMITQLSAYLDVCDHYYFINVTTGGYGITVDEETGGLPYVCGLVNSRLLDFYLKRVSTNFRGGYFAANKQYIEQLPIRTIDFSIPDDKTKHDRIVELVERMLELDKQLAAAKTSHDKDLIQRQIVATDREIDRLVYDLYGLTDDEIKIVEEAT